LNPKLNCKRLASADEKKRYFERTATFSYLGCVGLLVTIAKEYSEDVFKFWEIANGNWLDLFSNVFREYSD
jgi:hypothetical protein